MAEWIKVGTNVAVGGAGGAIDQLVQNQDEKREEEKGEKLSIMSQYGTYYNYGIPILAIFGAALGFVKGEWATRLITVGSTLAGRKVTWQVTKADRVVAYRKWTKDAGAGERARQLTESRARARAQLATGNELTIPIVAEEAILV